LPNRFGHGYRTGERQQLVADVAFGQDHREQEAVGASAVPSGSGAAPAGGLLLGKDGQANVLRIAGVLGGHVIRAQRLLVNEDLPADLPGPQVGSYEVRV
jgi:hypothetical protein